MGAVEQVPSQRMGESGSVPRWSRAPGARFARLAVSALLFGAALLALPAGAWALKLRPCQSDAAFGCGSIRVPLDHGGRTPGTLRIAFAAQRDYPKGAPVMIALSGGPGQSSISAAGSFALSLEPVLRRYRLVVLDQRGTGLSGALSCPGLQRLGGLEDFTPQAVARCARQIGPRRAFYRTSDTVEDLEALRKAFGGRKIGLMGISYGTWVAQEYARAYPTRTDSMILDSVVGPERTDAFQIGTFRRLPRVLREQCGGRRCKGATADIVGDMGKVVAKVRRAPLSGRVFDTAGRARSARYTADSQLNYLVTSGDINPFMQARIPGALGSAARGDHGPLLRLKRIGDGLPSKTRELSFGLNITTSCLDADLPFSLATDPATRAPALREAFAAIPPSTYAPWSPEFVYADDCLLWPRDDRPAASSGVLPDVRTLVLAGRLDMRTPVEDAVRVQKLLPRSELVAVPGNGHDQVDSDGTGCVERALIRWTARRPVGRPCAGKTNQVPSVPRAPLDLAEFRTPRGIPGDRGRALLAVLDSVEDARFSALEAVYGGLATKGGGLRGGSYSATDAFNGELTLRDYSYVPGVRVSGTLTVDGPLVRGRVVVRGRVTGTLDLRSTTAASGVLGGRRVAFARAGGARAARSAGRPVGFPAIPVALLRPGALDRRALAR